MSATPAEDECRDWCVICHDKVTGQSPADLLAAMVEHYNGHDPDSTATTRLRITVTTWEGGARVERDTVLDLPRGGYLQRIDVQADGYHLLGIPFSASGLGDVEDRT